MNKNGTKFRNENSTKAKNFDKKEDKCCWGSDGGAFGAVGYVDVDVGRSRRTCTHAHRHSDNLCEYRFSQKNQGNRLKTYENDCQVKIEIGREIKTKPSSCETDGERERERGDAL